jgi:hypothetical protein
MQHEVVVPPFALIVHKRLKQIGRQNTFPEIPSLKRELHVPVGHFQQVQVRSLLERSWWERAINKHRVGQATRLIPPTPIHLLLGSCQVRQSNAANESKLPRAKPVKRFTYISLNNQIHSLLGKEHYVRPFSRNR